MNSYNIKNKQTKKNQPEYSVIFSSEVLSCISLVENNNSRRFQILSLKGASRGNPKSKRKIVKVINTNRGILGNVFGHSGNVSLDDMISIQERHFTSGLNPDFMFGVLGHEVKTRYTEPELASFGELTDINASTKQLFFGYIGAESDELAVDVKDFIFDKAKYRLLDGVFNEVLESVTDILVEFSEEHFGLLVG
jgi:hypothetical protein